MTKKTLSIFLFASLLSGLVLAGNSASKIIKGDQVVSGLFKDTAFSAIGVVTNNASGVFSSAAPGTSGYVLTSNGSGSAPTFQASSGGVTALGSVGSSPNANGASLFGSVLNLEPADASNPGVITAGTQSLGGTKTFSAPVLSLGGFVANVGQNDQGHMFGGSIDTGYVNSNPIEIDDINDAGQPLLYLDTNGQLVSKSFANRGLYFTVDDSGNLVSESLKVLSLNTPGVIVNNNTGVFSSVAPGSSGNLLTSNGSAWVSSAAPASGVTALAAVGSSPNGNGGNISGSTLNFQPADGSNPGVLTAGTQTIGGNKTLSGATKMMPANNSTINLVLEAFNNGGSDQSPDVFEVQDHNGVTTASMLSNGKHYVSDGDFFNPSIAFQGEKTTGFYRNAPNEIGAAANHTRIVEFNPTSVNFDVGPKLSTTGSQPSCNSGNRGMMWIIQGGAGVDDVLQVCMKNSSDAYVWVTK